MCERTVNCLNLSTFCLSIEAGDTRNQSCFFLWGDEWCQGQGIVSLHCPGTNETVDVYHLSPRGWRKFKTNCLSVCLGAQTLLVRTPSDPVCSPARKTALWRPSVNGRPARQPVRQVDVYLNFHELSLVNCVIAPQVQKSQYIQHENVNYRWVRGRRTKAASFIMVHW